MTLARARLPARRSLALPLAAGLALTWQVCAASAQVNLPPVPAAPVPASPKVRPAPAPVPAVVPAPGTGAASGQPVPRFVSLKSDRVNVRRGPGPEHGIDWVFRRAGLPVEVIAEAEIWRRVRDSEGATGWVLASLLSGRRTALIEPWEVKANAPPPQVQILSEGREGAAVVARVEAGVIAGVRSCDGRWCAVIINDLRGYVEQRRLWGVYKGESVR